MPTSDTCQGPRVAFLPHSPVAPTHLDQLRHSSTVIGPDHAQEFLRQFSSLASPRCSMYGMSPGWHIWRVKHATNK